MFKENFKSLSKCYREIPKRFHLETDLWKTIRAMYTSGSIQWRRKRVKRHDCPLGHRITSRQLLFILHIMSKKRSKSRLFSSKYVLFALERIVNTTKTSIVGERKKVFETWTQHFRINFEPWNEKSRETAVRGQLLLRFN